MNQIRTERITCCLFCIFILIFSTTLAYADSFTIPSWVEKIAKYRAQKYITNEEFVNTLQYLLDNNIIRPSVNTQIEAKDTSYPLVTLQMNKTTFKTYESIQIAIRNIGTQTANFAGGFVIDPLKIQIYSLGHGIPEDHITLQSNEKQLIRLDPASTRKPGQYGVGVDYNGNITSGCCRLLTVKTFTIDDDYSILNSTLVTKLIKNSNKNKASLSNLIENMIQEKALDNSKLIENYKTQLAPKLMITRDKVNYKTGETVNITIKNVGSVDVIFDKPSSVYTEHKTCCYDKPRVLKSGESTVAKFVIPSNGYGQEVLYIALSYHSPYVQENHTLFMNIVGEF